MVKLEAGLWADPRPGPGRGQHVCDVVTALVEALGLTVAHRPFLQLDLAGRLVSGAYGELIHWAGALSKFGVLSSCLRRGELRKAGTVHQLPAHNGLSGLSAVWSCHLFNNDHGEICHIGDDCSLHITAIYSPQTHATRCLWLQSTPYHVLEPNSGPMLAFRRSSIATSLPIQHPASTQNCSASPRRAVRDSWKRDGRLKH